MPQPDEHAVIFDLLAQAHEVAGDLTKARETYEKITALTTGRLAFGATYARSFYHLGLIAEKQGDKARAREQFTKFLDLWKDADKGLLEDAQKRVAPRVEQRRARPWGFGVQYSSIARPGTFEKWRASRVTRGARSSTADVAMSRSIVSIDVPAARILASSRPYSAAKRSSG